MSGRDLHLPWHVETTFVGNTPIASVYNARNVGVAWHLLPDEADLIVKSVNDNGDLAAGFTHAVQTLEREHDANVKNGIRYCELRKAIDAILRELRNEDEIGNAINALPFRNEGAVAYLRALADRIERAVEAANPNQHEGRID